MSKSSTSRLLGVSTTCGPSIGLLRGISAQPRRNVQLGRDGGQTLVRLTTWTGGLLIGSTWNEGTKKDERSPWARHPLGGRASEDRGTYCFCPARPRVPLSATDVWWHAGRAFFWCTCVAFASSHSLPSGGEAWGGFRAHRSCDAASCMGWRGHVEIPSTLARFLPQAPHPVLNGPRSQLSSELAVGNAHSLLVCMCVTSVT